MCTFETETRKMVETETETLADLSVASIYKRPVFKVRDRDRDIADTVSTSETETE